MIKKIDKQLQELQKVLAEVQKVQDALRLQPCRGDLEIREKDGKLDELDRRANILEETIRDLTRKLKLRFPNLLQEESTIFILPKMGRKRRNPATGEPMKIPAKTVSSQCLLVTFSYDTREG